MTFSTDLLDQARVLYNKEPKRPKQASVRRSISASYYALFHHLADEGASRMMRASGRELHQELIRRAYQHSNMRERAKEVRNPTLPAWLQTGLPTTIAALKRVADSFIVLQEERHAADYALGQPITRARARNAHALATTAIRDWQSIRTTSEADYFLLLLFVDKRRG